MSKIFEYRSLVHVLQRVTMYVKTNLTRFLPTESIFYLREAMIWTLPCAIMSAIFVATAFMLQLIGVAPDVVANLSSLNKIFSSLIPIIATSSLAYIFSVKKRLPPMPVSLLALISTLVAKQQLGGNTSRADTFMLIIGVIIPFIVVPLVYWIYQKSGQELLMPTLRGATLRGHLI